PTAHAALSTVSLHDALPICGAWTRCGRSSGLSSDVREGQTFGGESVLIRFVNFVKLPHTVFALPFALLGLLVASRETALTWRTLDRKSTRLNSSHQTISYAV